VIGAVDPTVRGSRVPADSTPARLRPEGAPAASGLPHVGPGARSASGEVSKKVEGNTEMPQTISFWSRDAKWSGLSNFAPVTIEHNGTIYRSLEHAYLASRVAIEHAADIAAAPTARDAKIMMRDLPRNPQPPNKITTMKTLLLKKFALEPYRTLLLSTGDTYLSHYAPWDSFWGTGKDGKGENRLGHMLMNVRSEINPETTKPTASTDATTSIALVGSRAFGKDPALLNGKAAWTLLTRIFTGIEKRYSLVNIVSGGANGVDKMGVFMAKDRGHTTTVFPADWDRLGKSAGYARNVTIVENSDMVVAIMDPGSKGTRHTVHLAMDARLPLRIFSAIDGSEYKSCPCDDKITHDRIKAEQTYQTVSIAGTDVLMEGDDARIHRYDKPYIDPETGDFIEPDDSLLGIEVDGNCQTCGREMPEGECGKCATEVYGFLPGDNAPVETPQDHPDVTGHNYFIKPAKVEWQPNPFSRGTFYKIVNGHRMYTVDQVTKARFTKEDLEAQTIRLNAIPAGAFSFDVIAKNAITRKFPVMPFAHASPFAKAQRNTIVNPPLPQLPATMVEMSKKIADNARLYR